MNKTLKLIIIFLIICIFNQSCNNHSKSKAEKTNLADNHSLKNDEQVMIQNTEVNSDLILNKTFYKVEQTNSGDVIIDHYSDGIGGLEFDSTKIKFLGSEEWRLMSFGIATDEMDIDSIISISEQLKVFLSLKYENALGEKEVYTEIIKIQPIQGKPDYININDKITFVDSAFSEKISIKKQSLSDIKKAIGDF